MNFIRNLILYKDLLLNVAVVATFCGSLGALIVFWFYVLKGG
jgi:hypothetical protein